MHQTLYVYSKDILAFISRQTPHTVWLFMKLFKEGNDIGTRLSSSANSKKALASRHQDHLHHCNICRMLVLECHKGLFILSQRHSSSVRNLLKLGKQLTTPIVLCTSKVSLPQRPKSNVNIFLPLHNISYYHNKMSFTKLFVAGVSSRTFISSLYPTENCSTLALSSSSHTVLNVAIAFSVHCHSVCMTLCLLLWFWPYCAVPLILTLIPLTSYIFCYIYVHVKKQQECYQWPCNSCCLCYVHSHYQQSLYIPPTRDKVSNSRWCIMHIPYILSQLISNHIASTT